MKTMNMTGPLGVLGAMLIAAASVSAATFTDDFNRADSTGLGPNWGAAFTSWDPGQLNVVSNTAQSALSSAASYCNAYTANNDYQGIASVKFQASFLGENAGMPNLLLGINNTLSAGNFWNNTDYVLIQGVVGAKLFIDGDWRDTNPLVGAIVAGDWYTMEIKQVGADFTGTVSKLDGTIMQQNTYHSLVKTSLTGAAFLRVSGTADVGTAAFDDFSLTIAPVPEPAVLTLLALAGGLMTFGRRRRQ